LVEKHQVLCGVRQMQQAKIKVLLNHPGIYELLELHRADALASGRGIDHVEHCEQMLREWGPERINPPPLITGNDLLALRLPQGPIYRELLEAVREAQLDCLIRSPEEALALKRVCCPSAEDFFLAANLVPACASGILTLVQCSKTFPPVLTLEAG
jgi:poly(A) polymerase